MDGLLSSELLFSISYIKVMTLKDGTTTKKLVYCYNDHKQGKSSTGALRYS